MALHLIKLCVGCDTVEALIDWRRTYRPHESWVLRTRQTPKRAEDLLAGGSVYRVFRGVVLCRQAILAVDTVGEGRSSRCEITLDERVVLTQPLPRRAFQGWRYLEAKDAPEDLGPYGEASAMPQDLALKLRELGAW